MSFRRRATDIIDALHSAASFGKTDVVPLSSRCLGMNCEKAFGMRVQDVARLLRRDWTTGRGYYVTGRVTTAIYRNDCVFDGPDPDMPVRGLSKYLNVASQLFDPPATRSELLSMEIVDDSTISVHWRFSGKLRLPWRPEIPEVNGITTYNLDSTGLIYRHEETWDVSVVDAFLWTLLPSSLRSIWKRKRVVLQNEDLLIPSALWIDWSQNREIDSLDLEAPR